MAQTGVSEHLSPTDEISLEMVKARAVRGVAALASRTFFLQIVALFSTFLLTVFLNPEQYGVFFLVSAVINFFAYFSDVGLAAALIQKKEHPTEEELRTTFTVQQALVFLLVALIFITTPIFKIWYGISQQSVYLLWALAFSLVLSSLKTIPSVLLERQLLFHKLVLPQIVETILFYTVAVVLAWRGFGIMSFTIAVLVRSISGVTIIYFLRPWMPGFSFAKGPLTKLLRFGIPYQTNTFLAVAKDDGMTIVLGGILGPAGVGLIGWAQRWANAPLRFFMDPVIKVSFPTFSRMQHNKKELSNAVSRVIFFISLLAFPAIIGIIIVARPLTEIIPRYEKWQPALFALGLLGINALFAAVTTPLTNMLNAIGKISITFRLMLMWTALSWIFIPLLGFRYSVNGVALGFAIVGISSIVAIIWARNFVEIDFVTSILIPLTAALGMGFVAFLLGSILPLGILGVIVMIVVGIAAYLLILYLFLGEELKSNLRTVYALFRKR